jgi:hypothetical protein
MNIHPNIQYTLKYRFHIFFWLWFLHNSTSIVIQNFKIYFITSSRMQVISPSLLTHNLSLRGTKISTWILSPCYFHTTFWLFSFNYIQSTYKHFFLLLYWKKHNLFWHPDLGLKPYLLLVWLQKIHLTFSFIFLYFLKNWEIICVHLYGVQYDNSIHV